VYEKVHGPEHPYTLRLLSNLAHAHHMQRRFAAAVNLWAKVLERETKVLGDRHPDTLESLSNLALGLADQGKLQQSRKLSEQALALHRQVLGPQHPDTLRSMLNLSTVLEELGDLDGAWKLGQEVLANQVQVLGARHPDTIPARYNLAIILYRRKQFAEARKLFQATLALCKELPGGGHPHSLLLLNGLGAVFLEQGMFEDAAKAIHRQVVLSALHGEPGSIATARALRDLGGVFEGQIAAAIKRGRHREVEGLYRRSLSVLEKLAADFPNLHPSHREIRASHHNKLASFLLDGPAANLRDPVKAIAEARKAVNLMMRRGKLANERFVIPAARAWDTQGLAHFRLRDFKAAVAAFETTVELLPGYGPPRYYLAMAHWKLGNQAQARTWYERGEQWMEQGKEALAKAKEEADPLRRLRSEAAALLGVKQAPEPKPE
jgi:tetratricopeptide (TPR) repeat protein